MFCINVLVSRTAITEYNIHLCKQESFPRYIMIPELNAFFVDKNE